MVQVQVDLSKEENKIVNMVKACFDYTKKETAIKKIIKDYNEKIKIDN